MLFQGLFLVDNSFKSTSFPLECRSPLHRPKGSEALAGISRRVSSGAGTELRNLRHYFLLPSRGRGVRISRSRELDSMAGNARDLGSLSLWLNLELNLVLRALPVSKRSSPIVYFYWLISVGGLLWEVLAIRVELSYRNPGELRLLVFELWGLDCGHLRTLRVLGLSHEHWLVVLRRVSWCKQRMPFSVVPWGQGNGWKFILKHLLSRRTRGLYLGRRRSWVLGWWTSTHTLAILKFCPCLLDQRSEFTSELIVSRLYYAE